MRFVIVAFSLMLTILSVSLDRMSLSPNSPICQYGFCRPDQISLSESSQAAASLNLAALVNEDAANPFTWCTYGDLLALTGDVGKAGTVFDRAIALGPNMPPVLMRAANFDFTHDRVDHGLLLTSRIVSQTPVFDEVLFSYLSRSRAPVSTLLGKAIPVSRRPAQSWLSWLGINGSDGEVLQSWSWMKQNHLTDEQSALEISRTLWGRKSFRTAQELWADWIGSTQRDYLAPQLLANRHFEDAPNAGPFNWTISAPSSVEISRNQGLGIHFTGADNIDLTVEQSTVVSSGSYHFWAEVQSDNLTTDAGPFFRVFDPTNPARLDIQMPQITGTTPKSRVNIDFSVPPGTEVLAIQLVRRASERFDNKIQGTLHVYEVSLVPAVHVLK